MNGIAFVLLALLGLAALIFFPILTLLSFQAIFPAAGVAISLKTWFATVWIQLIFAAAAHAK